MLIYRNTKIITYYNPPVS